MMESEGNKMTKKRNKPSLTCTNCKQRKVKCDRNQPCSACMKSGNEATCTYNTKRKPLIVQESPNLQAQNSHTSANVTLEELHALKEKISSLEKSLVKPSLSNDLSYQDLTNSLPIMDAETPQRPIQFEIPATDADDSFYLYEGFSSIYAKEPFQRSNFGPLTWSCFMNKDRWLNAVWKYANEHDDANMCLYSTSMRKLDKEDLNILKNGEGDESKGGRISEKIFRRRMLEQDGYEEQAPFKTPNTVRPEEFIKQSKKMNLSSIALAKALFEGKFDTELHLFQKIKIVTPKKKALWSLVDIFFKNLYPFMPFVDQKEFISTLAKIFGPVSYVDEPVEEIKIKRKLDLAMVALFLIIIRLTYLSLFSNRDCVNEHIMNHPTPSESPYDYKYLLSTPINLTTIDVAQNCIDTFQLARKSNLSILQALIFMRIYHKLAPEYGDGIDGGDSVISSAILVQMALSLGLNREPDKFADVCNDERMNHLGRKIWATIVQNSYLNSMMNGLPSIVNTRNSDVLDPFFNGKNSNIFDTGLEIAMLEEFTWIPKKISLDNFLNSIISIKEPIKVNSFTEELNNIERFCLNELFTIGENSKKEQYEFLDVKRAQLFLHLRSALLSVYSHLFLHYEQIDNLDMAFFYMKKQLLIFYEEIIPYYFEITLGKYSSFGLALIPSIEVSLHKSNQLNTYTLARVNYIRLSMERNPNHFENLNHNFSYNSRYNAITNLIKNFKKVGDLFTMALSKFASRYYHAWRVSKAHSLLLKFLMKEDLYEPSLRSSIQLNTIDFNINQLTELEKLTNQIIDRFTKIFNYKDSYEQEVPQFYADPKHSGSPDIMNINHTSSTSSDTYFHSNDDVDKIWLSMLSNQTYPNVFGIDSEFEMSKDILDLDILRDLNFDNHMPNYSNLGSGW